MFALTPRLTLRPGWPEDAAALARAIGHEQVTRNLTGVPWPYREEDAAAFLAGPRAAADLAALIFDRTDRALPLVGGIELRRDDGRLPMLGYWLTPGAWGRGLATEAAGAVLRAARDGLRVPAVRSGHYRDNPASAGVLRKLGFRATGQVEPQFCPTRGTAVDTLLFERALWPAGAGPLPLAA